MEWVGHNPRYRLEAWLGEGGMGRVFQAVSETRARKVAVKILRSDPTDYAPAQKARFRQEAEAASRVGHPGIVEILDYQDLPDGGALLVMELLEGESLADWILGQHPVSDGLTVLAEVAEALHAAHVKGIVHRDIKPQNIFLHRVGGRCQPKILDFGIAKVDASPHTQIETVAGTVLGTPHYIAPERALGRPLDPRADLYSLGVILYEISTGRVPFDAASAMDVLGQHIRQAPLDPRLAAPGRTISKDLATLVLELLAKDPAKRPRDAATVATLLRRAAEDPELHDVRIEVTGPRATSAPTVGLSEVALRPTAIPAWVAAEVPRPRTRRWGRAAALLLAAAAALALGLVLGGRRSPPEAAPAVTGARPQGAEPVADALAGSTRLPPEGDVVGQAPAEGLSATPADGPATANDGGATAKNGRATAKDGGATAKDGGATAKDGGATAEDGGATANDGEAAVSAESRGDARPLDTDHPDGGTKDAVSAAKSARSSRPPVGRPRPVRRTRPSPSTSTSSSGLPAFKDDVYAD